MPPAHCPTDRLRGEVKALAAAGYRHEQIAEYVGVDKKTLYRHYRAELDRAAMSMIGAAVDGLYRAVLDREAWAICFLLKCRGKHLGWSERVEIAGENTNKIVHEVRWLGPMPAPAPDIVNVSPAPPDNERRAIVDHSASGPADSGGAVIAPAVPAALERAESAA